MPFFRYRQKCINMKPNAVTPYAVWFLIKCSSDVFVALSAVRAGQFTKLFNLKRNHWSGTHLIRVRLCR